MRGFAMTRRNSIAAVLALAALALPAVGCGGDDEEEAAEETTAETTEAAGGEAVTIDLAEQSGSGQSGTATLEPGDGMVTVTIELENPPADPQPAHIHSGTCPEVGDVVHPLTNVENGSSETEVAVSLEELQGGEFAINVHQSEADIGTYVACGDIS
jgi:hypothetical protein